MPGAATEPTKIDSTTVEPLRLSVVTAVSAGVFVALAVLQTAAAYGDALRRGEATEPAALFLANLAYYPPWVAFTVALFRSTERGGADRLRFLVASFAGSSLLFFVPYVGYEAALELLRAGRPVVDLVAALRAWPPFLLFVDFVLFLGAFAAVTGLALGRGQLTRERRHRRLQAELIGLRLELEQQRMAALQAQLEPHFLFNALSAIRGLVRGDRKRDALAALADLSDLLRYAVTATRRDWVPLAEELAFVRGYLELQRLRHGDRLNLHLTLDEEAIQGLQCPPLLLQPLVENALRHDLETHQQKTTLELTVEREDGGVRIRVRNPASTVDAANPGLGLGLAATRDRLALAYRGAAALATRREASHFVAELHLPDASGG